MMYQYYGSMMGGFAPFGWLTWLAVLVDLILLGIFLWQKITK